MEQGKGFPFNPQVIKPGTLLMSEPFMKDANFMRKVVMMVRHDEEGSIGFVLNQLTDWTVNELVEDFPFSTYPVYVGGPVSQNTLHYLHQIPALRDSSMLITKDLFWGGDFDHLKTLVKEGEIAQSQIRFFIGYSGWTDNQLAEEVLDHSWLISERNPIHVMRYDEQLMWKALVTELGSPFKFLASAPIDPALN